MLFKDKMVLEQVDNLRLEILVLKSRVEIQDTRIKALVKAYPNGVNKDGQPRKKIGRPHKKEQA